MFRWKHFAQPLLALSIISSTTISAQNGDGSDAFYCGGETIRGRVDAYFERLERLLARNASPKEFDRLVGERFSTLKDDRYLVFRTRDVAPITPLRISIDDWRQISKRGAKQLWNGGWRGCMLNNGKVWFQADGDDFYLSAINHDMPWED